MALCNDGVVVMVIIYCRIICVVKIVGRDVNRIDQQACARKRYEKKMFPEVSIP